MSTKLQPGEPFPTLSVETLSADTIELGLPRQNCDWQMVLIYRGKHCPMCSKYLKQLANMQDQFLATGIDIVIVSADPKDKAYDHIITELGLNFTTGINLSIEQMQKLGVYISKPRSDQETDRPFAEPGLFIVNEQKKLHVVDISNNPFVRPDLDTLLSGIKWIRNPENNYPIRGTFTNLN